MPATPSLRVHHLHLEDDIPKDHFFDKAVQRKKMEELRRERDDLTSGIKHLESSLKNIQLNDTEIARIQGPTDRQTLELRPSPHIYYSSNKQRNIEICSLNDNIFEPRPCMLLKGGHVHSLTSIRYT